eukprot:COSAG02_NODE_5115_length_4615_cov_5.118025_3_plen_122_part_00
MDYCENCRVLCVVQRQREDLTHSSLLWEGRWVWVWGACVGVVRGGRGAGGHIRGAQQALSHRRKSSTSACRRLSLRRSTSEQGGHDTIICCAEEGCGIGIRKNNFTHNVWHVKYLLQKGAC